MRANIDENGHGKVQDKKMEKVKNACFGKKTNIKNNECY